MFITIVITLFLVLSTISFRYWVLEQLTKMLPDKENDHCRFLQALKILILLFCSHVAEIIWFAVGLFVSAHWFHLGSLGKSLGHTFMDFFYHSAVTYSTLGVSSLPEGHLKFITAMESLTGIIILTWSATFFYSVMGHSRES